MATLVGHLGVVVSKQIVQLRVFNSHRSIPAVGSATTRVSPGVDAPAETVILDPTDKERCSLLNICTERAGGSIVIYILWDARYSASHCALIHPRCAGFTPPGTRNLEPITSAVPQ